MVNDHYPYGKWLFHWEYTQHFQTNPDAAREPFCHRSGSCPSGVTGGEPATLGMRLDHPWGARTTRCSGGTLWCYAGRVVGSGGNFFGEDLSFESCWLWRLHIRYKRMAARADITLSSSNIMFLQLLSNSVGNWFVVISLVSAPMESVRIGPFLVITSLGTRGYEMGLVWKVDSPDEGFLYRCFVIWFDLGMGQDAGTTLLVTRKVWPVTLQGRWKPSWQICSQAMRWSRPGTEYGWFLGQLGPCCSSCRWFRAVARDQRWRSGLLPHRRENWSNGHGWSSFLFSIISENYGI